MVFVIIASVIAIALMFVCIFKFQTIRIGHFAIDTFYLPLLLVAIVLLVTPSFDKTELWNILFSNSSLNPLKILVLFICVSFLSIALDETGFFGFIATIFIKKYKASQMKLFIVLYILISVLTVFTSNDIVILTFTPFILYFSKKGKINPIPYLVMEFVAANTWSMLLSIGNPTNIYLASVFEIGFLEYVAKMYLPAIFCGLSSLLIIFLLFRKDLKKPIDVFEMEDSKIHNKVLCIISGIHLILTTILLAISSYVGIDMWLVALGFAISLLLFLTIYSLIKKEPKNLIKPIRRIPYSLIPFILSMFTLIMALNSYDVFKNLSDIISSVNNDKLEQIIYLISSTLSCNVVNNIPMTLAFGSILSSTDNIVNVYASIIGSNLGALFTPVGALAGIMWLRILKLNDIDYSFTKFMKNGSIILLFTIIFAVVAVLIM